MRKFKRPVIVEKLEITAYAAEGKSLGRVEGKVVFVEKAVPGDVVDVRLTKNKGDFAEGTPVHFHTYAPDRVTPFCQHFGVCGGCQWQMLPYEKQLEYKQQQVYDNLSRIGKIPLPPIQPILGSEDQRFYRNKLEYTFSTREYTEVPPKRNFANGQIGNEENGQEATVQIGKSANGQEATGNEGEANGNEQRATGNEGATGNVQQATSNRQTLHIHVNSEPDSEASIATLEGRDPGLLPLSSSAGEGPESQRLAGGGVGGVGGAAGFHARGHFDKVVDIQKCWLQDDLTNRVRNWIRDYARRQGLSFYHIREHHGMLRTMQVRICTTGESMINVVVGEAQNKEREPLMQALQSTFPEVTTWLLTVNPKRNDTINDLAPQVWSGPGYVVERLEDFLFKIGPKSFFQTASKQAARLYAITRDLAELDGTQTLYDLYCGTGSIGIFCSRGARKLIGVEVIPAAIDDARENAAHNGVAHAQFFAGDVVDICNDDFFAEHGRPDVVITDPPRAGMHPALVQKLLDIAAPLIVYVSCNPATQARDLQTLHALYDVTAVQPVDMFPQTHHIECVVQLKKRAHISA